MSKQSSKGTMCESGEPVIYHRRCDEGETHRKSKSGEVLKEYRFGKKSDRKSIFWLHCGD